MSEACMYSILALPQSDLRRVLPKASTRTIAKLATAYPRAVGRIFLEILDQCSSSVTVEFIRDEMNSMRVPSYPEIRQAELELMKIVREECPEEAASVAVPATQSQQ